MKDRAALNMMLDGERSGKLNHDRTILDATSGNTGIAYAMIGANRGYKVKLVPARQRLRGAQAHPEGLRRRDWSSATPAKARTAPSACAARSTRADPDRYFYPDQYNNPANWKAHFEGTGREIIEQTDGRITHFVAAMGTSGTFTGTTRRLRRDLPDVKCYLRPALQRLPRPRRPEAHAHRHRAPAFTTTRWPTATCGSKPKTPTAWCAGWRGKKACWSASPPAATFTPPPCWHATSSPAGETARHRHRALRRRRQISERTFLGRRMIKIESAPWAAMVAHAQASYPNECCGAMIGTIDGETKTRQRSHRPAKTPPQARRPRATNCAPKTCWPPTKPPASARWT